MDFLFYVCNEAHTVAVVEAVVKVRVDTAAIEVHHVRVGIIVCGRRPIEAAVADMIDRTIAVARSEKTNGSGRRDPQTSRSRRATFRH